MWCGEHWLQDHSRTHFSQATDYFSFFFSALGTNPRLRTFYHFSDAIFCNKFSWSFFLTCNMTSIIASLPPPLLFHGRRTLLTALPKLPVCSIRGELHTYQSCYSGFCPFLLNLVIILSVQLYCILWTRVTHLLAIVSSFIDSLSVDHII